MHMRKHFISLLGLIVAIAITAKTEVTMYDLHGKPAEHNSGIPIVDTEDDQITIKSDSTIYNVEIIIRDQLGNVMHRSTQNIGPMETTISLPDHGDGTEKTTIDIYYDRKRLSGYFE